MTEAADTGDWQAVLAELHALRADREELTLRLLQLDERVEDIAGGLDTFEVAAHRALSAAEDTAGDSADTPESGSPATDPSADSDAAPAQEPAPNGLNMRELIPWVRDHIAFILERRLPQNGAGMRWCRCWWLHPEAIVRFDALRRSWLEAIAAENGNALVTYYDYLDRMLAALTQDAGPFAACRGGEHGTAHDVTRLGHVDPDPSYFVELDRLDEY